MRGPKTISIPSQHASRVILDVKHTKHGSVDFWTMTWRMSSFCDVDSAENGICDYPGENYYF